MNSEDYLKWRDEIGTRAIFKCENRFKVRDFKEAFQSLEKSMGPGFQVRSEPMDKPWIDYPGRWGQGWAFTDWFDRMTFFLDRKPHLVKRVKEGKKLFYEKV